MAELVSPDLAEFLADLLTREHQCGPGCPCAEIAARPEVVEVTRRRGPKPA